MGVSLSGRREVNSSDPATRDDGKEEVRSAGIATHCARKVNKPGGQRTGIWELEEGLGKASGAITHVNDGAGAWRLCNILVT